MSISKATFEEITEADLINLIDSGVGEGQLIEYKSQVYGTADDDKREFLKDVTSFANTYGGDLIIGMNTIEGVASEIAPVSGIDIDTEICRLENLLRDCVEPRITGIRIRPIPVSGGVVIVCRIPRSWNPPHRARHRKWKEVFARNSAGAHEMSMDEMRASFTLGASAYDRAREFRAQRLQNNSIRPPIITPGKVDRLIIHLIPLTTFFGQVSGVDLTRAKQLFMTLLPLAAVEGCASRFNLDGYLTYRGGPVCHGYTQLFRNGTIEAVWIDITRQYDNKTWIPGNSVESYIMARVPEYIESLRALEVFPPILITLTLQNVGGTTYLVKQYQTESPIYTQHFELPDILIDHYGTPQEYQTALRPFFDVLWNSAGFERAESFRAEDGRWIGLR
jgi:hypothetical protein